MLVLRVLVAGLVGVLGLGVAFAWLGCVAATEDCDCVLCSTAARRLWTQVILSPSAVWLQGRMRAAVSNSSPHFAILSSAPDGSSLCEVALQ